MFLLVINLFFLSVLCESDVGDLGYSLHIGNSIDVFANYGDLSQVTQVVSADYDDEDEEPTEPFREKNIRVFVNVTSHETSGDSMVEMNLMLCETFEDLLTMYFQNFNIEGTDKPWKAFMGDWIADEIMRSFGLEYKSKRDNCCYVLVKMTKTHKSVKLDDLTDVTVKDYVNRAIDQMNVTKESEIRKFMKSYGTHYIDSYVTGNFVYQVFKFKRAGYNLLRAHIKSSNSRRAAPVNLRFYFSSLFLKEIGDIRVANGNKSIETWARVNLRDGQYLYSRPSLLRLYYNPILAYKLNDMLDGGALLGIGLKTLRPLFKDRRIADRYAEIVENDIKLWEVNA